VSPRVGVVGHVEWIEFAVIDHFPSEGEIVEATEWFTDAAGSGAVAAVQARKLAGAALFMTALGDDDAGRHARERLTGAHGLDLHAAIRRRPQRRGFAQLDEFGERTITVMGERHVPRASDDLPWERMAQLDAVYLTGADAGAVRRAREAPILVATPRAFDALVEAEVRLDVLIASATDVNEQVDVGRLAHPPRYEVRTRGAEGGTWKGAAGERGHWDAVAPPGEPVDAYGCGDSFAAGVTYGLAAGMALPDALHVGARCGAWCLTGRGPYGHQLTAAGL
jgi:ribokinase